MFYVIYIIPILHALILLLPDFILVYGLYTIHNTPLLPLFEGY